MRDEARNAKIVSLYNKWDLSAEALTIRFGMSRTAVLKVLRDAGCVMDGRRFSASIGGNAGIDAVYSRKPARVTFETANG